MKGLLTITLISILTAAGANAQDTLKIQPSVPEQQQLDRIEPADLPEIIKQKLSGDQYRSWRLENAYKAPFKSKTNADRSDSVYYILELKKENETIRIWFDEAGNKKDN